MPVSKPVIRPIHPHLRRLISPHDHGLKHDGRVIHARRNADIVRDLDRRGWVPGLTNVAMDRHFAGEQTAYFAADGRIGTPEVLLMVDVDCHRTGTYASAVAFAEHLRARHFPGLYFEPSTNGNGVHAYLVLDKRGLGDERTHSLFSTLDRALKGIHAAWQEEHPDLVVELVEVKGHPPRIVRGRDGRVVNYTAGQLAKLPREVACRRDEFRATTRIDEHRVGELYRHWKVDRPATKETKAGIESGKVAVPRSGSTSGHVVDRESLDRFDAYLGLAARLLPEPLRTSGREVATVEDMAILLLILEACTDRMNPDGSLPTARVMKNWCVLYEGGEVQRPFNPKRYAAMRDSLSREELLSWEDESYMPSQMSDEGKGRAARWKASGRLMEMIREEKEGVEFQGEIQEQAEEGREYGEEEREEHLYGDNHLLPLFETMEGDSIRGNPPPLLQGLTPRVEKENRFMGNYSRWLRELAHDHFPRPVLRVCSRWTVAA